MGIWGEWGTQLRRLCSNSAHCVATMIRPDASDRLTYLPLHEAAMLSVQPAVAPLVVADLVDGALLVGRAAVGDIASV